MRVLLDEHLPQKLRHSIPGHDVFTVGFLGWSGTRNGALLRRAADEGFDVLLTLDRGLEFQQNLRTLPVAVLVIDSDSDDLDDLRTFVPAILDGLKRIAPRAVLHVR